jgi:hypothetical protein
MVAGQLAGGKSAPAVLAAMIVTGVDVTAGELGVTPPETNKSHQPDN